MNELQKRYLQYKHLNQKNPYLLPLQLGVGALLIVLIVIIPQTLALLTSSEEIEDQTRRVSELQESVTTLSSLSPIQLDEELALSSEALPDSKDFNVIYSVLSDVASDTGVVVEGFTMKVGSVYESEQSDEEAEIRAFPVEVDAKISSSSLNEVRRYAEALHERLPLSEVQSMKIIDGDGLVTLNFYHLPIYPDAISNQLDVTNLSASEREMLQQISQWRLSQ